MEFTQRSHVVAQALDSQASPSLGSDAYPAKPEQGFSTLRNWIASESQTRHQKELLFARMVKHSEILQNFDHKQLLQAMMVEVKDIRGSLAQFTAQLEQNNNRAGEFQRNLIDRIRQIVKILQERSELGSRLSQIYNEALPLIEECLQLNAAHGSCSGVELAGFELLEVISFQSGQEHLLNKVILICLGYFQSGCLAKHNDPSIALSCSSYLSNSVANSLIGNSDLNAVPVEILKGYFEYVLSLVCLKKSSRYCIISLRLARNILLRYSFKNPKNHHSGNASIIEWSQYLQQHLRVDYLIEQTLKYTSASPKDNSGILIEILWTINFSQKYSSPMEAFYAPSLFMQLTDYMFGQLERLGGGVLELIKSDQVALPYLSYLASVLALHDTKQLDAFTSGQNMKILNSLTSVLQSTTAHRAVKREAMLAISNYLAKGMELQCSEVIAGVIMNQFISLIEDKQRIKKFIVQTLSTSKRSSTSCSGTCLDAFRSETTKKPHTQKPSSTQRRRWRWSPIQQKNCRVLRHNLIW